MKRAWRTFLLVAAAAAVPAVLRAASLDQFAAGSFEARQEALEQFVKAGSDAMADLIKGASDKRLLVRMYSVKALGRIAAGSSLDTLKKVATKDPSPGIRAEAAMALGNLHTDEAAMALLDVVGKIQTADRPAVPGDGDRYVRLCAAQALCKLRTKHTVPILIALLKHTDDEIPPVAAKALADLTYFHFGADYAKWKEWWKANKDSFVITQTIYPHEPLEKK